MFPRIHGSRHVLAVLVGSLALNPVAAPVSAAPIPRFEVTSCDLPEIADVASRLRCGVVRVPRDHAHPDGPTYALAVVVVRSEHQSARPDPVVYISGGPGGPLTIYSGYQARHSYAPDRDLVLVDQRGTGRSEPRLCPDLQVDFVTAMLAVVTDPSQANLAADRAVHAACRRELTANSVDPDEFGTLATVEDFEVVRQALGVQRWNVVGESYGTTVALSLLARHPEPIRSAVLDSLNPPDAFFAMPWSQRVAHARDTFLAACEVDARCRVTAPDVLGAYRQVVAQLEHDAPSITLPPALHVPNDQVRLTASLFEEVVGRLVYYPPARDGLPRLITATRDGDLRPVSAALGTLLAGAEQQGHEGPFVAVECRDRPHWREPVLPGVSPLDLGLIPPGICAAWSTPGPEPEIPHDTGVPTLVLAGQFDPNITPTESRHVAAWLGPEARWVLFNGVGHSVRHFSPCAQRIVAAFIDAPDGVLDTTCAARVSASEPTPR